MSNQELAKGYEPADVEKRWIAYWEEKKSFCPNPKKAGRRYSIVIPPPNVTGSLHMGHALNLTLQDILCRHQRQLGANVLWVPGTDHAGIAMQNVVERQLATEGKSRDDLGRAAFIERVWEWKNEYGDKILNQVRRIGASVDWSRLRFTMDEGLSRAVRSIAAAEIPAQVAKRCLAIMELTVRAAGKTNVNLDSNLKVAMHMATAGMHSALVNIKINLGTIKDPDTAAYLQVLMEELLQRQIDSTRLLKERLA